jgi:hypothetical protein
MGTLCCFFYGFSQLAISFEDQKDFVIILQILSVIAEHTFT